MNDVLPPSPRGGMGPHLPRPVAPRRPAGVNSGVQKHTAEPISLELPPTQPLQLPSKPQRKWGKKLFFLLLGLVVIAIAAVLGGYFWYEDSLKPLSTSTKNITVKIESGDSSDRAAALLQEKGVIKNAFAASLYMKFNGKSSIKAGSYVFRAEQPVSEIVAWLNDGRVDTRKITILPGRTLAELQEDLAEDGFDDDAIKSAFAKKYSHPVLADAPESASLEGFIFPETYFGTSDTSVEQIIEWSLDQFEKELQTHDLKNKLAAKGFSVFQGVTLASIIEKEVSGYADKRQVAQVFERRLSEGGMLGSDPTYKYIAKILGVTASPGLESPYNTRIHPGLPPGPIGNFNLTSLEAIVDPAEGDYYYFVAGDDGVTHFSHTFAEHEENIAKYCTTLCQ